MSRCNHKILLEKDGINVTTCLCCRRIGLHYKNILCGFNQQDFKVFVSNTLEVSFRNSAVRFPQNKRRVILKTCHPDIQFCFDEYQLDQFKETLTEALLMFEVHMALETNG